MRLLLTSLLAASALAGLPALAADPAPAGKSNFTPAQREEMKTLMRDYLMENPEVIAEAITALQDKAQKASLDKNRKALTESPEGTILGNPKGDVTVVEFFDYNCGYCKSVFPTLMDTVKEDGKIKLVLKELPILNATSVTAAKAALAAVKQGKYGEMHTALLNHKGALNDETIRKLAAGAGLDVKQMEADMKAPEIQATIDRNRDLARALEVNGTPALVVGDAFVPGAIGKDALKDLVAKARAKS